MPTAACERLAPALGNTFEDVFKNLQGEYRRRSRPNGPITRSYWRPVSTKQSRLPIRTAIQLDGQLFSDKTIEELGVTFPVALVQTADTRPGKTANLFGLGTSSGVLAINPDGRLQMIQPDDVPVGVDISALEHQVRRLHLAANEDRDERAIDPAVADAVEQPDEGLTIVEHRENR